MRNEKSVRRGDTKLFNRTVTSESAQSFLLKIWGKKMKTKLRCGWRKKRREKNAINRFTATPCILESIDKHKSKERVIDNLSLHHILIFIESKLLGGRGDYDASLSARVDKCERFVVLDKSVTDLNDRVIRLHRFAEDDEFMDSYWK